MRGIPSRISFLVRTSILLLLLDVCGVTLASQLTAFQQTTPNASNRPPISVTQDDSTITQLIVLFESADYQTRIDASRSLAKLGSKVIEPLKKVIVTGGPEAKSRALNTMKLVALKNLADHLGFVEQALSELAASPEPHVSKPAKSTLKKLSREIEPAVAELFARRGATFDAHSDYGNRNVQVYSVTIPEDWTGTKQELLLLRRFRLLQTLKVVSDQFDGETLAAITSIPTLMTIELESAKLKNSSIENFSSFSNLRELELRYVSIDDGSIEALKQLTSLTRLALIGTRITDPGAMELQETFPGDRLDHRRGGYFGVRYNVGSGPCILTDVIAGTAAAKAGLKVGDQIVKFNGTRVAGGTDFRNGVAKCYIGDTITVEVLRDNETISLEAKLGPWKL